jgi:peroxiredoxin
MQRTIIVTILFFSACTGNGQQRLSNNPSLKDSVISTEHYAPVTNYAQLLIDTSLHFDNIQALAKYKSLKDSLYYSIRNNKKLITDDIQKLEYDNSILAAYLLFKYFKACDRQNVTNFNFLNAILSDYGIFSKKDLLDLFDSFPEQFKNSPRGISYLKKINDRPQNIGRVIAPVKNELLTPIQGKNITLGSIFNTKFHYYIISFTASWCSACRHWANVYKPKLEKLDTSKVCIISISIDTKENEWKKYIAEDKYTCKCYMDTKGLNSNFMKYLNFNAIPEYFLIDRNGVVVEEATGSNVDNILKKISL